MRKKKIFFIILFVLNYLVMFNVFKIVLCYYDFFIYINDLLYILKKKLWINKDMFLSKNDTRKKIFFVLSTSN